MIENSNTNNNKNSNNEYQILFTNTFYSYLINFLEYFFTFFTSILIARIISPELWGFLILATSYITIIIIILSFLPPGLQYSLVYFIPRYHVSNQKNKIKILIKHAIWQKLTFIIPTFLISLFIFSSFSDLFQLNMQNHINLLFILVPLIISGGLKPIFNSIFQGLNMFKTIFYMLFLNNILKIGSLIYISLLITHGGLESIAIIYLFSEMILFFIYGIFIFLKFFRIKLNNQQQELTYKESFLQSFNYGSYLSVGAIISLIWQQLEVQFIGLCEGSQWVTAYNISNNYASVARLTNLSVAGPLMITFTRFDLNQNYNQLFRLFNLIFHYTTFLLMCVIGILYFCADFFLSFFYGYSYLTFSVVLKLILIAVIFVPLGPQFSAFLQAIDKVKFSLKLSMIIMIISIPLFLIGLIYFGIIGAIYGTILSRIINFIIRIVLCNKYFKIKLKIRKIVFQYLFFFLSIGIILVLKNLYLNNLNYTILKNYNLLLFENFQFLAIISFLLIFITLNLLFGPFSYEDIEYLGSFFEDDTKKNKIIKKSLDFYKKFLRKKPFKKA